MFERNKWILGLIIGTMTFSGIAILDEIVVKIIFTTSGAIAYSLVGSILSLGFVMSRADAGQLRMAFFLILVCVFLIIYMALINFITWLFTIPLWIYVIIFIISVSLLVIRLIVNKKISKAYIEEIEQEKKIVDGNEDTSKTKQDNVSSNTYEEFGKTIYELFQENQEMEVIYIERTDNKSPGLEYVQVNRRALRYPVLKGYIKFDNAGVFREVFYPNDRIWRLYRK